jgi:hypothetical protein
MTVATKVDSLTEEKMALQWLEKNGLYAVKGANTAHAYFFHIMACLKQPRGRADGASTGSQQCFVSVELADRAAVPFIFKGWLGETRVGQKLDTATEIWRKSRGVTTYYEPMHANLTKFLNLGERFPSCAVEGASKLPPPPQGYTASKVVVRLLAPFIAEVIERSEGRLVVETTFNVMTVNDLDGVKLPPLFHYAPDQHDYLRQLALVDVNNLTRRDAGEVSPELQSLAQEEVLKLKRVAQEEKRQAT